MYMHIKTSQNVVTFIKQSPLFKGQCRIGGVMVSVLISRGFDPRSAHTKDYKIGICCFSAKHTVLRRKSKDWLAQVNVSKWGNMSMDCVTKCVRAND